MKNVNQITDNKKLPALIWVIIISTCFAVWGEGSFLGLNISGFAWVFSLGIAALVFIQNNFRTKFPIWIWFPWILLLTIYYFFSEYNALQRTIQLICPIIVGISVASLPIQQAHLASLNNIFKKLTYFLIFIALYKTGVLLTGHIPYRTGLAAEIMLGILLCTVFACQFSFGEKTALYYWTGILALTIFAITRTGIMVAGCTLPFTFGPLGIKKRIFIIIAGIFVMLIIFNLPRIQYKMFYSGKGTISDIREGSFADHGRKRMWKIFKKEINKKPIWGHGTGSGEKLTRHITNGVSGYPHNDWLLTTHDQGYFGIIVYTLTMLGAIIHLLKKSKSAFNENKLFLLAGAFSFVAHMLMMTTDNIMIYVSYYGNLQFTIIGMAYASLGHNQTKKTNAIKPKFRIRW